MITSEKCLAFATESSPVQEGHLGERRERPVKDTHGKKILLHAQRANKTPQLPGINCLWLLPQDGQINTGKLLTRQ
jgi:hypothetical protein